MQQINVFEAKTHLSKLLERVESGEEIIIARGGKPIARLISYQESNPAPRKPGRLKGRIHNIDSLLEPDPELEQAFLETPAVPNLTANKKR
jgi:prevent-host-death family protein